MNVAEAAPQQSGNPLVASQTRADFSENRVTLVSSSSNKGNLAIEENTLKEVLLEAERTAKSFNRNLKFTYKEEAGMFQVEVIEGESNEIIRQIPPDGILRLIENIRRNAGLVVDTTA